MHPEVETLDREWAEERKQYLIRGRFGRNVPRTRSGCGLILGCLFFTGLTALFLSLPGKMPDFQRYLYSGISVVIALTYAGFARLEFSLKKKYDMAETTYLKRREIIEKSLRAGQTP